MAQTQYETYDLPVAAGDHELRLTPRLRERYLTPQTCDGRALCQATGDRLAVWVWTDREDIRLWVPLNGFVAERPFTRSIHRWGINVNRWEDCLSLDRSDDRPTVTAHVETVNVDPPELIR